VKGHTGRGTRKAMDQHAVNILNGEKERRTMELRSRCEKSLHYWVHMVSTVSAYADTYIPGIARNRYYTKINIPAAFYRFRIKKGNKWKIAFRTLFRLFE
jgi:hypothetical protein